MKRQRAPCPSLPRTLQSLWMKWLQKKKKNSKQTPTKRTNKKKSLVLDKSLRSFTRLHPFLHSGVSISRITRRRPPLGWLPSPPRQVKPQPVSPLRLLVLLLLLLLPVALPPPRLSAPRLRPPWLPPQQLQLVWPPRRALPPQQAPSPPRLAPLQPPPPPPPPRTPSWPS